MRTGAVIGPKTKKVITWVIVAVVAIILIVVMVVFIYNITSGKAKKMGAE